MKRLTILTLFLFSLCVNGFSQGDCEYYEDKVDDMTKDTIASTWAQVAQDLGQGLVFTFKKVNSSYYIRMGYGTGGTHAMVIGKDDKLIIKLKNDSLITLLSTDVVSADFTNTSGVRETKIICFYKVTKEQLAMMNTAQIQKVRFYTTDSFVEMEASTKKKKVKKLYKALGCILQK